MNQPAFSILINKFYLEYVNNYGKSYLPSPAATTGKALLRGELSYFSNLQLQNIYQAEGFEAYGLRDSSVSIDDTFVLIPELARAYVAVIKIETYFLLDYLVKKFKGKIDEEILFQTTLILTTPYQLLDDKERYTLIDHHITIAECDENYKVRCKSVKCIIRNTDDLAIKYFNISDLKYVSTGIRNSQNSRLASRLTRMLKHRVLKRIIEFGLFSEREKYILSKLGEDPDNIFLPDIVNDDDFQKRYKISLSGARLICSKIRDKFIEKIIPFFPGYSITKIQDCAKLLVSIGYFDAYNKYS